MECLKEDTYLGRAPSTKKDKEENDLIELHELLKQPTCLIVFIQKGAFNRTENWSSYSNPLRSYFECPRIQERDKVY